MKVTPKEENRADRFLQRNGIQPDEVRSFQFMQRPSWWSDTTKEAKGYGPGLLTLQTTDGRETTCIVHTRNHPSAIVNTLMSRGIPFTNLLHPEPVAAPPARKRFSRPSLYQFWYTAVFIMAVIMELWAITSTPLAAALPLGICFGALSLYALFLLLTHFCHLTLDGRGMEVHSMGRTVCYPYARLCKVNFDFAREQNSTHVMELLETVGEGTQAFVRYHLYYIGRVPRTRLNEIADLLRSQGIDATCSLNDEKRHFHDVMHHLHN